MRVLAARYELQSLIGRGGMGEVWQGVDRELGRTVAIKVLPAELTRHDEFRTRFRREARTVASLSHQGVATLYDVGEDTGDGGTDGDTTPFLVMEFVDGRTLSDVLRDGPVPAERALAIARDVADALVHSHGRGLVHRDIKPSNVMLTATGSVKVLDFGIAKALAETTTRLTATGMTVGTPAYLSPEQIDGGAVDGRSDLYSLGCLVYELLAGHPPFSGDSPFVVMNQHLVKDPSPPSALRPQIPAEVDALVLRLLAKSPAQRPASAAELRGDLDALQARLQDATAPGPASQTPPPPAQAPFVPPQSTAPASSGPGTTPAHVSVQPTAIGPGGPRAAAAPVSLPGIPAPPSESAAAHAATRLVPPSLRLADGDRGPWAVRFRVTADGIVALLGIALTPLMFLSIDPDGFGGLNYVAPAVAGAALVALFWSARLSALLAWCPPAVLAGALFAHSQSVARGAESFPRRSYGREMGWEAGDLTSQYAAAVLPLMLVGLFALVTFLRSRSAPVMLIAAFWVTALIVAFSCGSWGAGKIMGTAWTVLGVLVAAVLAQELVGRRRSSAG